VEELWTPSFVAAPSFSDDERATVRTKWLADVARAEKTLPELSSVSF
jgi:hypothetical protein